MPNHDENKNFSRLMWLMMLCCALPFLFIILFGAGGQILETPIWFIFGGMAIMMIIHFLMMKKTHKNSDGEDKNHSDHGCCR
ncbi:MAG: hypothetical protein UV88_C0003G0006 [Parcubacteria group bacterium GW2011_GWA1_43_21]|uniref:DUF2933 domain-containing protein n=1 Tax=Candidatus Vogelbacteria bacterium RIFOXYB1_FULL_42_16 TaxID=1802436 RepID=A0A1G2QCR2_9BACT|nr:MAG: hypothetical protein UV50_C0004G0009 [Parcubacteria group bacterium GW2011_GWB1_42_9]KKT10004.1 MAG: hypothetical protein UV88_C0003G0006 [Parcubacteria group bacterium GW2011_GWA1_43_21]OHA58374.1 MAG: hypothetical protein A2370_01515 [Candidatus Vogelbacteria bacterium RIFOXYB1_FULL_42_16]